MKKIVDIRKELKSLKTDEVLKKLYGDDSKIIDYQKKRYLNLLDIFERNFPQNKEASLFSAPGRVEIGGNHTDHNGGRVLTAAVNMDVLGIASPTIENVITIYSDGYKPFSIDLSDLTLKKSEYYTSTALVRGICSRMKELGYKIGGFNACITSNVLKGSGLSSSAAFEMEIVNILNHFYNLGEIEPVTLAKVSQYAENNFFGKPCGLMDMTASAVGGFIMIDFKCFENPVIEKIKYNFNQSDYTMIIVDTGGNHADLNEDYVALENEMKLVANSLGGNLLREFSKEKVIENMQLLRKKLSDRAILRAIHFFDDDKRVVEQVDSLKQNDINRFLKLINDSGISSWQLCQNCYSQRHTEEQGIPIALMLSSDILKGKGALRVHGGGFAGTIQVFVPNELLQEYSSQMRYFFGEESVIQIKVREEGACKISI